MNTLDGQLLKQDEALAAGWLALIEAVDVSNRAPLSARHAMHAAALIDRFSDMAYVRRAMLCHPLLATAGDVLTFRAALRASSPALGSLIDLTACGILGPRLQVMAQRVECDGFASLPVEDLMVSLYNAGAVPRLMLVQPGKSMLPMQALLRDAVAWWGSTLAAQAASKAGRDDDGPVDTATIERS